MFKMIFVSLWLSSFAIVDTTKTDIIKSFTIQVSQPGTAIVLDRNHFISTTLPIFRFEPVRDLLRYRLIIADVTDLDSFIRSEFKQPDKVLKDLPEQYQIADTVFFGYVFDYPRTGIKLLQPNREYWYQIVTAPQDKKTKEIHHSQIYGFEVTGTYEIPNMTYQQELRMLVKELFGSVELEGVNLDEMLILDARKGDARFNKAEMLELLKGYVEMHKVGKINLVNN